MAAVVGGLRSDTLARLSDDRVPLLAGEEPESGEEGQLEGDFESEYALRTASLSAPAGRGERRRRKRYSGNELIVAVFVVAFDTKKGRGGRERERESE